MQVFHLRRHTKRLSITNTFYCLICCFLFVTAVTIEGKQLDHISFKIVVKFFPKDITNITHSTLQRTELACPSARKLEAFLLSYLASYTSTATKQNMVSVVLGRMVDLSTELVVPGVDFQRSWYPTSASGGSEDVHDRRQIVEGNHAESL